MSIAASRWSDADIVATSQQAALQQSVSALETNFEARGWSRNSDMVHAARDWMGRLTGQSVEPQSEPQTAIAAYLDICGLPDMDGAQAGVLLKAELTEAADLVRDVNAAALAVTQSGASLNRLALTRDLAHVERSITHTRRAIDVFGDAIESASDRLSAEDLAEVEALYAAFTTEAEHLSDRADEISELRRNGQTGALS